MVIALPLNHSRFMNFSGDPVKKTGNSTHRFCFFFTRLLQFTQLINSSLKNRMKEPISVKGARTHNLRGISLQIPPNQLIVCTGVSGSGKSSFAFDTVFVEGQRRYVESLSQVARRHMGDLSKPDVDHIAGLSPTISIEQKSTGKSPRSTVGTLTEIYDYLRVLWAKVATAYCPIGKDPVEPQSKEQIISHICDLSEGSKIMLLSPLATRKKGEFREEFAELVRKGYVRCRVDGEVLLLDQEISLDGSVAHTIEVVIDRLVVNDSAKSRIADSVTTALEQGDGQVIVAYTDQTPDKLFSQYGYSKKSGLSYPPLIPQDFSFNNPTGMCDRCQGLGETLEYDLDLIINPELSIRQDCCSIASSYQTVRFGNIYDNLAKIKDFSVDTPWKDLPKRAKNAFLYGLTGKKWVRMQFHNKKTGHRWSDYVSWKGVIEEARTKYTTAKSASYKKRAEALMHKQTCPDCQGSRLKPYPSAAQLKGITIQEFLQLTLDKALSTLEGMRFTQEELLIAEEIIKEVQERIQFLLQVGLHYLTLSRPSPTLSGGEAQRVRLSSQIGCGLVGVTYILDEPSIGLHPRDNEHLIQTLLTLRDKGNTVIVVEHDEETIAAADQIIDFGPGAGVRGGKVVFQGSLAKLTKCTQSLTADYLTGKKQIAVPQKRRKVGTQGITMTGATHHNLRHVSTFIPSKVFIAVTGVSGSGKSSLITDTLYPFLANTLHKAELACGPFEAIDGVENIDKVIAIDQSPIGKTPRSNPATYVKILDEIRALFAQLPEAKARGYGPGRFSFNVKEGSCTTCAGMGMIKVDMDFLEDQWVECTTCQGRRFDSETLSVHYKGKSIYDILEMDITDAVQFFANIPNICKKLNVLQKIGLDYVKLGQPSPTLSGGEAQRIKLAKELVRPSTGNTLYILDEPTTGLHFHDIQHLLSVLQTLVDQGNTVLVIEHNTDMIKSADWVIDLGPDGGAGGGKIIGEGTPEKIAKKKSPTGIFLQKALQKKKVLVEKKEQVKGEMITDLVVSKAEENNLQQVSVSIPLYKTTVFTGPSGSGKSSLAFDTIYAEGQRRYTESLSPYARQFVQRMPKPKVAEITGLHPAIAIEQKIHAGNPRSTVGTMTEIYDFLRIAFARAGQPFCPETGEKISAISKEFIADTLLHYKEGEKILLLAPIPFKKGQKPVQTLEQFARQGYLRCRINKQVYRLDELPLIDQRRKHRIEIVVDRFQAGSATRSRIFEAIDTAENIGKGQIIVQKGEEDQLFNVSFSVASTGKSYPEITPHTFSFNAPDGMCPDCQGLGVQYGADLQGNKALLNQSVIHLLFSLWGATNCDHGHDVIEKVLEQANIDPTSYIVDLDQKKLRFLLEGTDEAIEIEKGLFIRWQGINPALVKLSRSASRGVKKIVLPLLDEHPCNTCQGERINALARHVQLQKKTIGQICQLPLQELPAFVESIPDDQEGTLQEVIQELQNRIDFLLSVGLGYLSLSRSAPSLSGGEAQRIRLARQLGTSLRGVLYVLDEPTIGLHPFDNERLNTTLEKLKDLGNTLLIVEHDPLTIARSDNIVEFGPKAGVNGGKIVAEGTYRQIIKNKTSTTGQFLRNEHPTEKSRNRKATDFLKINNASLHNLQNVSTKIPIACFTCVTGVSGSGKSTLIQELLLPAIKKNLGVSDTASYQGCSLQGLEYFDRVISVDQNPIGRTARADVGTYCDVLPLIRQFFAKLPQARSLGLKPGNFSFNHRRGMCSNCWGMGYKKVELHFLPAVRMVCPECKGMRLNPVSLQVQYEGLNFGEHLEMTVDQIKERFQNHPKVVRILQTLQDVGLGYLALGQRMQTLSGGEAQRIKLSKELCRKSYGKTLYILDEPTTGLSSSDVQVLLQVLHKIIDQGNTLICIEHNTDMIQSCDHIIDMGPGPGDQGGKIVASGPLQKILSSKKSLTAQFL